MVNMTSNVGIAVRAAVVLAIFAAPFATIGTAHADTPASVDPPAFYVVPDVDADPTAACLLDLGWTGHAGDAQEAIYAPSFVIDECSIAPRGMVPLSTDDVTPAVWSELIAIGYHGDPTDGTDDVIFVPAGTGGALQMIADGINR